MRRVSVIIYHLIGYCHEQPLTTVVYSIIFMIPPAALFIHSPRSSHIFLITIFSVSAWNGATFYVEVFGRKWVQHFTDPPLAHIYPLKPPLAPLVKTSSAGHLLCPHRACQAILTTTDSSGSWKSFARKWKPHQSPRPRPPLPLLRPRAPSTRPKIPHARQPVSTTIRI
jgi:hypothetical protein